MSPQDEPLFRRLAEHSLVGIYIIQKGRIAYANPQFAAVFGYAPGAVLALDDWRELIAPVDRDAVAERVRRRLAGEEQTARYTFRGLRRDGAHIDVEVYASRTELRGQPAVLGNLTDITERRRGEVALRESEELFRRAFEDTEVPMVLTDLGHRFVRVNAAFARLFGYEPAEMLGMTMAQVTHPGDVAESYARREPLLAGASDHFQMEKRYVRKDGRVVTALTNVSLVRDAAGRPRLYVGQVQDVTERKRAEAQRDELLRRLQLQVERMPLAHLVFDDQFRLADWNPAAERIFKFSRDEVLGMGPPFEPLVPPAARTQTDAVVNRLRAGDMAAHSVNENLTKDGRTITCEWLNTPLMTEDDRFAGVFCLAQDVTERQRLEEQLRQAQKMEAVGQLAGGVAHDFNNLLTVISGYCEMALSDPALSESSREMIREVHRAGDKAASLTRQLLAFSRKQALAPQVLDLNGLVREAARMLKRLLGEEIDLATALSPDLGRMRADPGQVEQVLMNLVVNARDAMPAGGKLTVGTQNVRLGEEYARSHLGVTAGRYVLLAVSDTGTGMTPNMQARIFEPFFTTKGAGKGTGLGLSTVFGIVKQSGGHVEVYSEPGEGTTFKVYLPRLDENGMTAASPSAVLEVPRGTETVLVAEDDEGIRRLARVALESCGYRVLEAARGDEALGHAGPIDLLITDVVMPGMSGRELAQRLRSARPGLRVLYISGYTDEAVVRHGIVEEGVAFLHKPFTPTTLARKVREVLDAGPSRFG